MIIYRFRSIDFHSYKYDCVVCCAMCVDIRKTPGEIKKKQKKERKRAPNNIFAFPNKNTKKSPEKTENCSWRSAAECLGSTVQLFNFQNFFILMAKH